VNNIDSPPLSIPTISIREGPSENSLITGRKNMEYANIGLPIFDGQNYAFCNKRMKMFLQRKGFDV
jgi:hypothetical protein